MIKHYSMATSTIQVQKPTSYEKLESQFRLIRYIIPDSFHRKSDNYKLLHVELRKQLTVPYLTFKHDELDRAKNIVIYALYPRDLSDIQSVTLSFISDSALEYREIKFHQINLFNLVKLLQAEYLGKWPHFASMGDYYVHAKDNGKDWHICMSIKIQGNNSNIDNQKREQTYQEFWVTGHAKHFNRASHHPDEYLKRRYPYYKRLIKNQFVVFEQLPYDQIDTHRGDLFQIYSKKTNPARLPYHAQNSSGLQPSKGYFLHQFTTSFVDKLQDFGLDAKRKSRDWFQYTPQKNTKDLPQKLSRIYLYDNRLNKQTNPFTVYQDLLKNHYSDYDFVIIKTIEETHRQPVLIFQDTTSDDYQEDGLFFGEKDPYKTIYRQYTDTPKQSINVNINAQSPFTGDRSSYLDYPMFELTELNDDEDDEQETIWAMQFQVCLYQLYLKNIVINQQSVSTFLPVSGVLQPLMTYIYIRKQTSRNVPYHIMMFVQDDYLSFRDLGDPEQKAVLSELTEPWGYDWIDIENLLLDKYHKRKDEGEDVRDYDLILMPDIAIELETLDETVLYDYAEIERRLSVRQSKQPVENFKLLPHYDRIKPKSAVSAEDLEKLGLLDGRKPDGDRETISVEFFAQLQQYDEILDNVRMIQSRITYDEFVKMRREEIGKTLKLPLDKHNIYNSKRLLEYYKVIWNIGGFKSEDVQLSKGIWFDPEDSAYMVGDVSGFNNSQDKANLVRKFDVLIGNKAKFNMQPFLEATAVQFIRYRQYTVYPYPFYLIEKYIQDVLYHQ